MKDLFDSIKESLLDDTDDFLEKDLEDGVKERIKINIRTFKHM